MEVHFRDSVASFLVMGVAVVDSAAERPWLPSRAEILLLKGAECGRHRRFIGRGISQEDLCLQATDEEDVAVFLEATATATGHAEGARVGDCAVNLLVQFQNLAANFFGHKPGPVQESAFEPRLA
jgi:hypothetical protein